MRVHVAGLDAIGAMIDEQGCLPLWRMTARCRDSSGSGGARSTELYSSHAWSPMLGRSAPHRRCLLRHRRVPASLRAAGRAADDGAASTASAPPTPACIITASTLAVAATAPFTGALSRRARAQARDRRRDGAAADPGDDDGAGARASNQLIFWRFVQGLLLPPIFAVTIAYIGDEWPPGEATGVIGLYASASAVGGFLGRFIPGMLTALCRLARRLPGAGRAAR